MKMLFIIFAVILFTSCSANSNVDCQGHYNYNPKSFTSDEVLWIENSFKRWNTWVGYNLVNVSSGSSEEQIFCSIDSEKLEQPNRIGQFTIKNKTISIDINKLKTKNIYNKEKFESVIMHEIGHALGFIHVKQNESLMSPVGGLDFSTDDYIQCLELNLCN